MSDFIEKVGIRSLKANLSRHLNQNKPIAVTNNGKMIGIYLPLVDEEELELPDLLDKVNKQWQGDITG